MGNCNLSLQVLPVVDNDTLYAVVDRVIEMIDASGFAYTVGPMETTIEGDLEELLHLVKRAKDVCEEAGVKRMCFVVKIDYSSEGVTIAEKVAKYR